MQTIFCQEIIYGYNLPELDTVHQIPLSPHNAEYDIPVTLHNDIPKSPTYEKVTWQNEAQIRDRINIYVGNIYFQDINWMEICRM